MWFQLSGQTTSTLEIFPSSLGSGSEIALRKFKLSQALAEPALQGFLAYTTTPPPRTLR